MILEEEQLLQFKTKQPKKIAFLYPPYGILASEPGLKVVKENYGVFPSLSLLYVAGAVEGAGHDAVFFDLNASPLSLDDLVRKLKDFKPDYLAVTLTTYHFRDTLIWLRELKEKFPCPVIAGGVHCSIYGEETISHPEFDILVRGECELVIPPLLEAGVMDVQAFSQIPGLIFKVNGDTVNTGEAPYLKNPDHAHFPARHLLDNSLYYSFITKYKNFTPFISSRGCPFQCIFCEQGSMKFRGRSAENILDELCLCFEKLHVREFDFFDSSFTIQKQRVLDICNGILKRNLKIHWAIRSRVDCIDEEMLVALKKAGCERIYYGVESGNEVILKTLKKKTDLEQIRTVLKTTRKIGIDTFGYFMIGSPGDTEETVRQTIDFSKTLALDYAQYSKVTPMPRTELYEMFLAEFKTDYWREHILNPKEVESLPRPGCNLEEDRIRELCKIAYMEFYFRPSMIFRSLLKIRSFTELTRSVKTAFQMLFARD
jgi:radical SAM superfamily enzyme YgiQ (UPF0313 family)